MTDLEKTALVLKLSLTAMAELAPASDILETLAAIQSEERLARVIRECAASVKAMEDQR